MGENGVLLVFIGTLDDKEIPNWIKDRDDSFDLFYFWRKKGSEMKKRTKEEEIKKGDYRSQTQKV